MSQPLSLERKLEEWARANQYPITDRVWHSGLTSLQALEHGLQHPEPPANLYDSIKRGLDFLMIPTFKRVVYTPSGFVEYRADFEYQDDLQNLLSDKKPPQDEKTVNRVLESGGEYLESFAMIHGPTLEKWWSDDVTIEQRTENADINLYFLAYQPLGEITEASFSPVYHGSFPNPITREGEIARVGNDRLNRLAWAIQRLTGPIELDLKGKNISDRPPNSAVNGCETYLAMMFYYFDNLIKVNNFA